LTALYIIGGIILLIALLLILPITARIDFKDDFFVKIKYLGITVYKITPKDEEKEKPKEKLETTEKPKEKQKGLFTKLTEKHGFKGAVKEMVSFALDILKQTKKQLLKIKLRNIKIDLIVVGSDAAQTAIDYGAICGVVYPVLSIIDQNLNVKYKKINITAGFKQTDSQFAFSLDVKANPVLLLIIALKAVKEYKNFSVRNELQ
jgi:hypothetical protein